MIDFSLFGLLFSATVLICISAFILGGLVKGTLGVGLPLLAVPMMSMVMPSSRAIGLVAVPVLLSNLWQMIDSRRIIQGWTRFWPLILMQLISTVLTVRFTLSLNEREMNQMVAASMLLAVFLMVLKPTFKVEVKSEKKINAVVGLLSGLLGGVSSLTGPVIITYLMALKLTRDEFIGCISIIYLSSGLPLYAAMLYYGRMDLLDLSYSAMALIPMVFGLCVGKIIRDKMSEKTFRLILYAYLVGMSIALFLRS
jgi:hypothetical protein